MMPRADSSPSRPTALDENARVLLIEHATVDVLIHEEVRVADVDDADTAQHLTHDRLDVLVVDASRPAGGRPVGSRRPGTPRAPSRPRSSGCRAGSTELHVKRLTGPHEVALVHDHVLALRNEVLVCLFTLIR